jgi:hypothetical protein
MRKWIILFAGVGALTSFAPSSSFAQGFEVGVPGVDVRVGDSDRYQRRHYRDDAGPRYREREVYLGRRSACKTVTIERDDGSAKRIRRCD